MLVKALKAKIHRATVTDSELNYPGSIAVDETLLKEAGIRPYEEVLLANINNGERVETYVVPAPAGSGRIGILGAAARRFEPGDIIIVINFGYYKQDEMESHKPVVVVADENNGIKKVL